MQKVSRNTGHDRITIAERESLVCDNGDVLAFFSQSWLESHSRAVPNSICSQSPVYDSAASHCQVPPSTSGLDLEIRSPWRTMAAAMLAK